MTEDEAMDYLLELLSGVGDEVQDIADNYGRFSSLHEKFRDVLPGYDFAHTYKLRTSYVLGALEMLKLLLWSHDTDAPLGELKGMLPSEIYQKVGLCICRL